MKPEEFRTLPREKQVWYYNHFFGWLLNEAESGRTEYIVHIMHRLNFVVNAGNFSPLEILQMQKKIIKMRIQAQKIIDELVKGGAQITIH